MLYPHRILCSVFALSLFLIFFFSTIGFTVDGVVRADLPSDSCFADPFDLCMNCGMRIKN